MWAFDGQISAMRVLRQLDEVQHNFRLARDPGAMQPSAVDIPLVVICTFSRLPCRIIDERIDLQSPSDALR
jgi:hypothetical protein